jgi:methyl-accepting chemotaxis protein
MSILGRAAEEAASRAGGADDRAREAAAVAAQNQAVFKGLAASMTQLTRKIESAEQRVSQMATQGEEIILPLCKETICIEKEMIVA